MVRYGVGIAAGGVLSRLEGLQAGLQVIPLGSQRPQPLGEQVHHVIVGSQKPRLPFFDLAVKLRQPLARPLGVGLSGRAGCRLPLRPDLRLQSFEFFGQEVLAPDLGDDGRKKRSLGHCVARAERLAAAVVAGAFVPPLFAGLVAPHGLAAMPAA